MLKRKRHAASTWIEPKTLGLYVTTVLGALGSFAASHQGAVRQVEDVRAESEDARYVMRQRVDSLIGVVNAQGVYLARLERRAQTRDRLDPVPLQYLGPPAPVHRGIFSRMLGFLRAPANH